MAEGLLKEMLKEEKGIRVSSCGILSSFLGSAASQSIVAMKGYGIDISAHKTKTITKELIDKATLILVMDRQHKERVQTLKPEAKKKVWLLKEFAGDKENLEVKDPIGLSADVYKEIAEELRAALKKALPKILEVARG
jgi:protein-tyrosine phosphatase